MVNVFGEPIRRVLFGALSWFQTQESPFAQLDRRDQVRLLAALVGLVILGLTGMLMAWLGARAARRYMRRGDERLAPPPSARSGDDDWARKPLTPPREP